MAVLLELSGANMFRVRSYQNGSRLIGSLSQDLGELVASGEIFELKGIIIYVRVLHMQHSLLQISFSR